MRNSRYLTEQKFGYAPTSMYKMQNIFVFAKLLIPVKYLHDKQQNILPSSDLNNHKTLKTTDAHWCIFILK